MIWWAAFTDMTNGTTSSFDFTMLKHTDKARGTTFTCFTWIIGWYWIAIFVHNVIDSTSYQPQIVHTIEMWAKKIEKLKSIAIKEITYQFHWQCRKMLFSNVKMDNNQCLIIVFFNHYIDSWFEKRSIYSRIWLIKIDNVMINKTNRYQWPIENCILILIRKKT